MRVVKYPHPMLSYKSKPLKKIDQGIRDVVAEMFRLMYSTNGVGLAANQVDLPYQLVVINPTGNPENKDSEYVFINPVILKLKGVEDGTEGCLSYPGVHLSVPRAKEVKFQAVDLNGNVSTYYWKGFEARIIQHETDHLIGKSFFQRVMELPYEAEMALERMRTKFEQDRLAGLEPTDDEFMKNVERLESERC